MALNLASPGIVVKEVDLTIGRTTPSSDKVGAMVAPFAKGPINLPTLIENENGLLNSFGKPYATDKHYEHWLTASSYLAYGGQLRIIRSDDSSLANGYVTASGMSTTTTVKINSLDHYNSLGYDENVLAGAVVAARNPGTWGNALRVAIIDAKADQILGFSTTTPLSVGMGITQSVMGRVVPGAGSTSALTGWIKGIITEVETDTISVKVLSHDVGGTETALDYQQGSAYEFKTSEDFSIYTVNSVGVALSASATSAVDWFDSQTVGVTSTTTINWHNVANKPGTSAYGAARNSRFDEVHVLVIDADGSVSGNAGTILEKHLGLSKAKDAVYSVGSPSYWRAYLAGNSTNIFGLGAPTGITTTNLTSSYAQPAGGGWDQDAENVVFDTLGSQTYALVNGKDYGGQLGITSTGALTAGLSDLSSGYDLFEAADFPLDFLLMGSAAHGKENAQALANKLISVAELRKDTLAFISPYRGAAITDTSDQSAVNVRSAADITTNVLSFYSAVSSSSYGVFDSGYKYMYDRFANTFRYVPLNGDIAGLCARTDINSFPWFSPAGTARGGILNAVKLAYNPTKSQRDQLYSARINPVMFSPGAGIVLFGDKTGLAKGSAFDRINVRRLFIHLENAISGAAKDQMFEFNDELTRSNFVNTVEPFLRDVQSNRGITDYVVICDETNNTAAVIDNNEFVADIFIKPARSINFVGLTFVATRTGVDFEEVIGNV